MSGPSYTIADAMKLPLLFHGGGDWNDERRAEWLRITGTSEATTKVMCDHLRAAAAIYEAPAHDHGGPVTRVHANCLAIVAEIGRAVLKAGESRDQIADSDLDNEQPISLTVRLQLGQLRRLQTHLKAGTS